MGCVMLLPGGNRYLPRIVANRSSSAAAAETSLQEATNPWITNGLAMIVHTTYHYMLNGGFTAEGPARRHHVLRIHDGPRFPGDPFRRRQEAVNTQSPRVAFPKVKETAGFAHDSEPGRRRYLSSSQS